MNRASVSAAKRGLSPLEFTDATHVRVRGREWLYFGGSNYLGLAQHPGVLGAMRTALEANMTQPGASRATTGEQALYLQAERTLARFFRQPAAVLVASGYMAPMAAIQALRLEATHLWVDIEAHQCVKDAATVAGLPCRQFGPGAVQMLAKQLSKLPATARPVVLTDGVFGTRGGMAPLDEYLRVLPRRGWLLVDDAHGAGVVGPGGRGAAAHCGLDDPRLVQTLSLAKAFGVGGGAVLGPERLMQQLRQRAAAFVGSTAMPLVVVSGILAALRLLRAEPERLRRLQSLLSLFHSRLPVGPQISSSPDTPVTSICPANEKRRAAWHQALTDHGIYPVFIRYLSGPDTGFFRFGLSAEHTPSDVEQLARAIQAGLK